MECGGSIVGVVTPIPSLDPPHSTNPIDGPLMKTPSLVKSPAYLLVY